MLLDAGVGAQVGADRALGGVANAGAAVIRVTMGVGHRCHPAKAFLMVCLMEALFDGGFHGILVLLIVRFMSLFLGPKPETFLLRGSP